MAAIRRDLGRLIADFRAIPPDARRELRPELRRAVTPALQQMRAGASWSTRIPGATKITSSLAVLNPKVRIVVDPKRAPHAMPHENRGRHGWFRHPVFANRDVWVRQRARPFFYDPVDRDSDRMAEQIADVVPRVLRRHGFH